LIGWLLEACRGLSGNFCIDTFVVQIIDCLFDLAYRWSAKSCFNVSISFGKPDWVGWDSLTAFEAPSLLTSLPP
jgi:hypothetical protein